MRRPPRELQTGRLFDLVLALTGLALPVVAGTEGSTVGSERSVLTSLLLLATRITLHLQKEDQVRLEEQVRLDKSQARHQANVEDNN